MVLAILVLMVIGLVWSIWMFTKSGKLLFDRLFRRDRLGELVGQVKRSDQLFSIILVVATILFYAKFRTKWLLYWHDYLQSKSVGDLFIFILEISGPVLICLVMLIRTFMHNEVRSKGIVTNRHLVSWEQLSELTYTSPFLSKGKKKVELYITYQCNKGKKEDIDIWKLTESEYALVNEVFSKHTKCKTVYNFDDVA